MGPMVCALLWAVCALPIVPPASAACPAIQETALDAGWLHFYPTFRPKRSCPTHVEPYVPQAGDIVLFDDTGIVWKLLDAIACTLPPDHAGLVVAMPDGRLTVLESGPDAHPRVHLLDLAARLHSFKGRIYIRRLSCPLTPEQSARMTEFALAQEGKRYALGRILRQITPFRARGPLRSKWFGKTDYNRQRWICSELVAAALAYAGLVDPRLMPANIVYPRDFLDNRYHDLHRWDAAAIWSGSPACLIRKK